MTYAEIAALVRGAPGPWVDQIAALNVGAPGATPRSVRVDVRVGLGCHRGCMGIVRIDVEPGDTRHTVAWRIRDELRTMRGAS